MPSKELIEKVARAIIENPPKINRLKDMETLNFSKVVDHTPTAEAVISTILAALQEPTEGMIAAILKHYGTDFDNEFAVDNIVDDWSKMLTASALGEQSE